MLFTLLASFFAFNFDFVLAAQIDPPCPNGQLLSIFSINQDVGDMMQVIEKRAQWSQTEIRRNVLCVTPVKNNVVNIDYYSDSRDLFLIKTMKDILVEEDFFHMPNGSHFVHKKYRLVENNQVIMGTFGQVIITEEDIVESGMLSFGYSGHFNYAYLSRHNSF